MGFVLYSFSGRITELHRAHPPAAASPHTHQRGREQGHPALGLLAHYYILPLVGSSLSLKDQQLRGRGVVPIAKR